MAAVATDSWLTFHWTAAGIVSAAARFLPIPFVDEKIQRRCRRYVVEKTLAENGSQLTIDDLQPLFDPEHSVLASILAVPAKLVLFPIRKLAKIVTSFRGVPIEILNIYLLGRTLHRHLGSDTALEAERVDDFEKAFSKAFQQIDLRIARAAISDVLTGISDWKSGAKETAAEVHQQHQSQPTPTQVARVEQSAREVSERLERPELTQVFERFDARFDQLFEV